MTHQQAVEIIHLLTFIESLVWVITFLLGFLIGVAFVIAGLIGRRG